MKSSTWYAEQAQTYMVKAESVPYAMPEAAMVKAQTAQVFATLALAAAIHEANEQVELTGPPRGRSQVIATSGGRIEGVSQSVG